MWLENAGRLRSCACEEAELEGRPSRLADAPGRTQCGPNTWEVRKAQERNSACHTEAFGAGPCVGCHVFLCVRACSSGHPLVVVLLFLFYRL